MTFKQITVNSSGDNISRVSEDCKIIGVVTIGDDIIVTLVDSEDKPKTKMVEIFAAMDGDTISAEELKALTPIGTVVLEDEDEHIFMSVLYRYI